MSLELMHAHQLKVHDDTIKFFIALLEKSGPLHTGAVAIGMMVACLAVLNSQLDARVVIDMVTDMLRDFEAGEVNSKKLDSPWAL